MEYALLIFSLQRETKLNSESSTTPIVLHRLFPDLWKKYNIYIRD